MAQNVTLNNTFSIVNIFVNTPRFKNCQHKADASYEYILLFLSNKVASTAERAPFWHNSYRKLKISNVCLLGCKHKPPSKSRNSTRNCSQRATAPLALKLQRLQSPVRKRQWPATQPELRGCMIQTKLFGLFTRFLRNYRYLFCPSHLIRSRTHCVGTSGAKHARKIARTHFTCS